MEDIDYEMNAISQVPSAEVGNAPVQHLHDDDGLDANHEESLVRFIKDLTDKGEYERVYQVIREVDASRVHKDIFIHLWDEAHYREKEVKLCKPLTSLIKFRIRSRFVPPVNLCPSGVREVTSFPKHSRKILSDWLALHLDHPYPSNGDKERLAEESGLTVVQVSTWFANHRRHLRKQQRLSPNGHATSRKRALSRGDVKAFDVNMNGHFDAGTMDTKVMNVNSINSLPSVHNLTRCVLPDQTHSITRQAQQTMFNEKNYSQNYYFAPPAQNLGHFSLGDSSVNSNMNYHQRTGFYQVSNDVLLPRAMNVHQDYRSHVTLTYNTAVQYGFMDSLPRPRLLNPMQVTHMPAVEPTPTSGQTAVQDTEKCTLNLSSLKWTTPNAICASLANSPDDSSLETDTTTSDTSDSSSEKSQFADAACFVSGSLFPDTNTRAVETAPAGHWRYDDGVGRYDVIQNDTQVPRDTSYAFQNMPKQNPLFTSSESLVNANIKGYRVIPSTQRSVSAPLPSDAPQHYDVTRYDYNQNASPYLGFQTSHTGDQLPHASSANDFKSPLLSLSRLKTVDAMPATPKVPQPSLNEIATSQQNYPLAQQQQHRPLPLFWPATSLYQATPPIAADSISYTAKLFPATTVLPSRQSAFRSPQSRYNQHYLPSLPPIQQPQWTPVSETHLSPGPQATSTPFSYSVAQCNTICEPGSPGPVAADNQSRDTDFINVHNTGDSECVQNDLMAFPENENAREIGLSAKNEDGLAEADVLMDLSSHNLQEAATYQQL